MHLCYVDDSGDSKNGTTLSALMVPVERWSGLLESWLQGRRDIHRQFGVGKNTELHANLLYKGRGRFCESSTEERRFGTRQRAATGRIMLNSLARVPGWQAVTIASPEVRKPRLYAQFVAWLEDWAEACDDHLLVFYDGKQGAHAGQGEPDATELSEMWESAVRNAAPFRRAHRDLDIATRRVVEDVVMQDSRYSQFIQAADLIAYGAYHRHRQERPDIWGEGKVVADAIRAYMRLKNHWYRGDDARDGIVWLPE
ncbi:hypothetical protein GCM10023216_04880 [Isoptericola chiayiensis]|uniref:DUF3800 domain-containing protein n=1 Tax=Isoptericola chiayiensis TaxID=579446 RepID=A0ABP8Y385_9MICO|nr:hypothetical protein [Isoptericola chiayiensis]